MKLHLGCGQRYLDGYWNVDFPAAEHTVQTERVADELLDFSTLQRAPHSVDEVRLHHVFEHFPRPQALGLVSCWHAWLREGGLLRIEVPDFALQALSMLNPLASRRTRRLGTRHLFGSHEARWAVHCEGWTGESLGDMARAFGFAVDKLVRNHWRGTHNVELFAHKRGERSADEQAAAARAFLTEYLVDDSPSERAMLDVWLSEFARQQARGRA